MSTHQTGRKTALVVLVDGVEELEAVAPIDCLRRAGVQVTVASANTGTSVEGRNGIRLVADTVLRDPAHCSYDLVVIPGGPGHKELARREDVVKILRQQDARGGLVGSICAGPVVLNAAGILRGRAYTSHPTTGTALPERDPGKGVVRDGNLVTSQGAGTAVAFALELVEALCGSAMRREVADSICWAGQREG